MTAIDPTSVRLKLRTKLTLTYLAVGFVLTLSTALSALWLEERWERVSYERSQTVALSVGMAAMASEASEEGFSYVLTGETAERDQCLAAIAQLETRRRQIARRVGPSAEVAASLARLQGASAAALVGIRGMLHDYESSHAISPQAIRAYEAPMDRLTERVSETVELIRKHAADDDSETRAQLHEILVGITLGTGGLAMAMGTVFGHHLTRPLVRLRDAAVRLGRGELDPGPLPDTNDEFGEVADAFSDMAMNIRKLLATVAQQGRRLEEIFGSLNEMLLVCGPDGSIISANNSTCKALGYSEAELVGRDLATLFDAICFDDLPHHASSASGAERRSPGAPDLRMQRKDGRAIVVSVSTSALRTASGASAGVVCVVQDLTDQRRLEAELRQAQKLEAIGRLSSGIAHGINTPIQFVSDSVHFAQEAASDMAMILAKYQGAQLALASGTSPRGALDDARAAEAEADLPYVLESLPGALGRAREGLLRITNIVKSMKVFAYPDQEQMAAVDLNQAIQATLTVAHHEYEDVAELATDFGDLPAVTCHVGELNQAFLNLIVNAAHAVAEKHESPRKGLIRVRTRLEGASVVVSISDSGNGIPEAIRDRIFEPFFTTKAVGQGTGQGLAVVRTAIVDRHRGQVTFDCEPGLGTTFHLRLPLDGAVTPAPAGPTTVAA